MTVQRSVWKNIWHFSIDPDSFRLICLSQERPLNKDGT